MTGTMRLPLRPQPLPHEALSSWASRLAAAYALPVPTFLRLAFATKPTPTEAELDGSGRPELAEMFADRTGLPCVQVRAMTLASYTPELVGAAAPPLDLFASYACRFGWFMPPGPRVRARLPQSWMPWQTDDFSKSLTRCCMRCLATDPIPYVRLHWRLGWMGSCPLHGEMLSPLVFTASKAYPIEEQEPQRAALNLLAMDQITLGAVTTGTAVLPRGSGTISGGAWLRALRTLLDELVQPVEQISPLARGEIASAWLSAGKGHEVRQGRACVPFEGLRPTQRALLLQVAGAAVRCLAARPGHGGVGTALRPYVTQWSTKDVCTTLMK